MTPDEAAKIQAKRREEAEKAKLADAETIIDMDRAVGSAPTTDLLVLVWVALAWCMALSFGLLILAHKTKHLPWALW